MASNLDLLSPGCCGGGSDVTVAPIPDCVCTSIPASIPMASADEACNYGMFQSCTITYQAVPAGLSSLNFGDPDGNAFLSDVRHDPLFADAPEVDEFRYLLHCQGNQFTLTRVYEHSAYNPGDDGSFGPYRDGILYTWLVGGSANTCAPFRMTSGGAYPGSDSSCEVELNP